MTQDNANNFDNANNANNTNNANSFNNANNANKADEWLIMMLMNDADEWCLSKAGASWPVGLVLWYYWQCLDFFIVLLELDADPEILTDIQEPEKVLMYLFWYKRKHCNITLQTLLNKVDQSLYLNYSLVSFFTTF